MFISVADGLTLVFQGRKLPLLPLFRLYKGSRVAIGHREPGPARKSPARERVSRVLDRRGRILRKDSSLPAKLFLRFGTRPDREIARGCSGTGGLYRGL